MELPPNGICAEILAQVEQVGADGNSQRSRAFACSADDNSFYHTISCPLLYARFSLPERRQLNLPNNLSRRLRQASAALEWRLHV
jgi:hypothetical protein